MAMASSLVYPSCSAWSFSRPFVCRNDICRKIASSLRCSWLPIVPLEQAWLRLLSFQAGTLWTPRACRRRPDTEPGYRMWINESVICAAYTYKWGVALPVWWASGLSFQIALMAVLGIVAKLRVPYAHTSLEFMRIRYGRYAHWIFIVLNLINNIFGCGSMILAGAQLVTGITGMHIVAACILIPAGGRSPQRRYWSYHTD